jgi:hypothetical protein
MRKLRRPTWMVTVVAWVFIAVLADGFQEPYLEVDRASRDETFYAKCTLRDVENLCARNITMAQEDGSIIRAPGVTVWIQAHCGSEDDEQKRSLCVLAYIGDDFGEDQAAKFFSCVCDECPRACHRQGNLRNRQNLIANAKESK